MRDIQSIIRRGSKRNVFLADYERKFFGIDMSVGCEFELEHKKRNLPCGANLIKLTIISFIFPVLFSKQFREPELQLRQYL